MATTRQALPTGAIPTLERDASIAIISTEWNSEVTDRLTDSCVAELDKISRSQPDIDITWDTFVVPGAVELTYAASQCIEHGDYDAVIVFGCVVRGGTPHFDYVCQSVTQGVTNLNADCDIPVIFGVLTVDILQQALDRAGGSVGDKGSECADCAIKMIHFSRLFD